MSQLRVLSIGDSPQMVLYTWRLVSTGKYKIWQTYGLRTPNVASIELFTIETCFYGNGHCNFERMFDKLESAVATACAEGVRFEMVLLSARSLQELTYLVQGLVEILTSETVLVLESSGYVQLEPHVLNAMRGSKCQVFSVVTDYDMRYINATTITEFNGKNKKHIYLGQSVSDSIRNNGENCNTGYDEATSDCAQRLRVIFEGLFPADCVDLCGLSHNGFLAKQWEVAIPQICFDLLLILLEQEHPVQLKEHVVTKPLVLEFVTEIITLCSSMGVRLEHPYNNANELLEHWISVNGTELPRLVYRFWFRQRALDLDMLLLQPILLANEHGIKTFYLNIVYTVMCQYEKMNSGYSRLFQRVDVAEKNGKGFKRHMERYETRFHESQLRGTNRGELKLPKVEKNGVELRKPHQHGTQLRESKIHDYKLYDAQLRSQSEPAAMSTAVSNLSTRSSSASSSSSPTSIQMLSDIQEFAIYGFTYNDDKSQIQSASPICQDVPKPPSSESTELSDLQLREHEIKRRELLLKEREIEFHRRMYVPPVKPLGFDFPSRRFPHPVTPFVPSNAYSSALYLPKTRSTSRDSSLSGIYPGLATKPLKKTDRKNRLNLTSSIRNASSTVLNDLYVQHDPHMGLRGPRLQSYAKPVNSISQRNSTMTSPDGKPFLGNVFHTSTSTIPVSVPPITQPTPPATHHIYDNTSSQPSQNSHISPPTSSDSTSTPILKTKKSKLRFFKNIRSKSEA